MTRFSTFVCLLLLAACSSRPPRPVVPALTPENAAQLLHYDTTAQNWLRHITARNQTCQYQLDLPDQRNHPTEIDLRHIVVCGGRPSPMEFDASVSFRYDKNSHRWVITRFSS